MKLLDTHQHLLYPDQLRYGWTETLPALAKAFTLANYQSAIGALSSGIEKTIFVEVDVDEPDIEQEAAFICRLAEDPQNRIAGVIAACRPEQDNFAEQLERLRHPKLVGLRRVLHVVPDELSQSDLFRDNIRRLAAHDLTFDLCVRGDQLNLAYELAAACPEVTFILDHCGNPTISSEIPDNAWKQHIQKIASLPHLNCKLSGLVTQAPAGLDTLDTLKPYLDYVLDQFGERRLLFGGDWPVCQLTSDLLTWHDIFQEWLNGLSLPESSQTLIAIHNAQSVYRLGK